ncbi:hypothetical protein BD410DRAFT_36585 [Rickenella mellea]|uniref:Uncharacterized protein n=1 Tax=Rickenella mellea TaxID=50990 RepID=A0A4V3AZM6_9AGAM|nr:hypothetical protein BD410DRAFT_36585 [Rickenella mellea]
MLDSDCTGSLQWWQLSSTFTVSFSGMPRLLPRLLECLARNPLGPEIYRGPLTVRRRRRRSLWEPPEIPPSLSSSNRTHSVLLDFTSKSLRKEYARHKTLPPVVNIQKTNKERPLYEDAPREMTEQERRWWSSPYLRMLASPVRKCILTRRFLPSDFLLRLAIVRMRSSRISARKTLLVPDGLQNSKFKGRILGEGRYVLCWKDAIESLVERGIFKRLSHNFSIHSLFCEQIGHNLRLRVLQELELLEERVRTAPRIFAGNPALSRLTRSEWKTMKLTGLIPWEGAVAVIITPPPNRDPKYLTRPPVNMTEIPLDYDDSHDASKLPPLPPQSVLYLTAAQSYRDPAGNTLPNHRVPLYNALALFPSRTQRAALHQKLSTVLRAERDARRNNQIIATHDGTALNEKPSHAYVLFSDKNILRRVDTVPVASALWRVRMWGGAGWEDRKGWEEQQCKSMEQNVCT